MGGWMTHPRASRNRIRLVRARGFLGRLRGLLCRATAPGPRTGFWLKPCSSIHTFGMRFAIDVAFIDRAGKVQRLVRNVPPGRMVFCFGAASAVELAVNRYESTPRYRRRLQVAVAQASRARRK
ncbi:DUF192 domain-containing protein [Bordetella sp. 02P26C-1]|uniref:DUF192 domain-containing protein n=1 Tax=Bordetella sp. 02P26C-1 TaxID=2683195 RepID=UPI003014EAFE